MAPFHFHIITEIQQNRIQSVYDIHYKTKSVQNFIAFLRYIAKTKLHHEFSWIQKVEKTYIHEYSFTAQLVFFPVKKPINESKSYIFVFCNEQSLCFCLFLLLGKDPYQT